MARRVIPLSCGTHRLPDCPSKQAGVPCDTVQEKAAKPYQAIIATAADRGCDLIVMATHGHGGLSAVVLGSVTNKVLTHTKIPVLVCH
jgi:nucleotide-binding universal stress UspA family protein